MKKRLIIVAILVVLAMLVTELCLAVLQRQRERLEAEAAKAPTAQQFAEVDAKRFTHSNSPAPVLIPIPINHPIRIALGSLGLADGDQDGRLSDLVLAQLNGAPGLEYVDRQSLQSVLRELNMSQSGLVRAEAAVRAGKLLKADWFLLGTHAKIRETNSIVIRLIDARTGIFLEAGVFSSDKPLAQLAGKIAAFIKESRQQAAAAKPAVFLALGGFEDLSMNSRQANFPAQLRAYLTSAYQGGKVTLLEREYVDILLQEVRLDLAGLTDEEGNGPPAPLQSAYWIVDGTYQAFQATNLEVEVTIKLHQMFGVAKSINFQGQPDDHLDQQIKQGIDQIIDQDRELVRPTRKSEFTAEMGKGKALSRLNSFPDESSLIIGDQASDTGVPMETRRRNLEEAVRAFETALLLDPGNAEVKIYLAACYRSPLIERTDEARAFYREIVDSDADDKWRELARKAAVASFYLTANPEERRQWFASAALQSTNTSAKEFFAKEADLAGQDVMVAQGGTPEAEKEAERRLFADLQAFKNDMPNNSNGAKHPETAMRDFSKTFHDDAQTDARRLVELLPRMRSQVPDLEAHILAAVVTFQTETNAPIITEFEDELAQISTHSHQVLAPEQYWSHLLSLCHWGFDHKDYELVVKIIEANRQAAVDDKTSHWVYGSDVVAKIAEGYAYLGMENWQSAKTIFDSLPNNPVMIYDRGPWGDGMNTVSPGEREAYCAAKLGVAVAHDPREFSMGKACGNLSRASAFAVEENGVWIGSKNQLLHLDFDFKTNLAVTLPKNSGSPITCLSLTPSSVWLGTEGEGLIEVDKASHQCRQWTDKDGLVMNNIACLGLAGGTLWIGYGNRHYGFAFTSAEGDPGGGVGQMDLSKRQFTSFPVALADIHDEAIVPAPDLPPRSSVIALAPGAGDDVWFVAEEKVGTLLRRYRTQKKKWEMGAQTCSSLASGQAGVFMGQFWNYDGGAKGNALGVSKWDSQEGKWRAVQPADGLPSGVPSGAVSALALDGQDLWVGGMGYVALLDGEEGKIRKYAQVQVTAVDQIQIGGGYLWAEYSGSLHRVLLQEVGR